MRTIHCLPLKMIPLLSLPLLLLLCGYTPLHAQTAGCYECHSDLDDAPSAAFANDVHRSAGFSCADCHGGDRSNDDMDIAMSEKNGFTGIPQRNEISILCGGCHDNGDRMKKAGFEGPTGQLSMLRRSVHGGGPSTESTIIECTNCHGAHGIRRASDPASPVSRQRVVQTCSACHANPAYMQRYNPGLATDQLAKYRTSVHGKLRAQGDFKTATCADCHTAHEIKQSNEAMSSVNAFNIPATCGRCHSDADYMKPYNIPTDQNSQFATSVHGIALLENHDAGAPSCNDCHGNHGAAPPDVESVSNVCGNCHVLNAELFRSSPHAKEFRQRNLPECETCHGNHAVAPATEEMLGVGIRAVCTACHSKLGAPRGYQATIEMRSMLDSLMMLYSETNILIDAAEQKGMEIDDIRFALRDVKQARLQSRTAIHAFNLEAFSEVIGAGMTIARHAHVDAIEVNDEFFYRRAGLAVATGIITLNVILLALYIRRIERRQKADIPTDS